MGRPSDQPFEVQVDIPRPERSRSTWSNAIGIALANRLDLKSRVAASIDADNQVRFSKNQLLPQVDVNLALTRRETSNTFRGSFGLDGYQFATFFTIAMPVDRTTQQVDYQSAILDRDRRKREIATLERQIADDVKAGGARARSHGARRARRRDQRRDRAPRARGRAAPVRERPVEQSRRGDGRKRPAAAESRRIQALADSAVARLGCAPCWGCSTPGPTSKARPRYCRKRLIWSSDRPPPPSARSSRPRAGWPPSQRPCWRSWWRCIGPGPGSMPPLSPPSNAARWSPP